MFLKIDFSGKWKIAFCHFQKFAAIFERTAIFVLELYSILRKYIYQLCKNHFHKLKFATVSIVIVIEYTNYVNMRHYEGIKLGLAIV